MSAKCKECGSLLFDENGYYRGGAQTPAGSDTWTCNECQGTKWTKEWPAERGWHWFYGQTSRIVYDLRPEYIPVRVRKNAAGEPVYVGSGRFLYKAEGARGLWTPMVTPDPPTDFQIEEVLK